MSKFIREAESTDFWQPCRIYTRDPEPLTPREKFHDRFLGFKRGFEEPFPLESVNGKQYYHNQIRFPILVLSVSFHDMDNYELDYHPGEYKDGTTKIYHNQGVAFLKILDANKSILYLWCVADPNKIKNGTRSIKRLPLEEEENQA